jgi:fumarate reductase flavoprotein subunit
MLETGVKQYGAIVIGAGAAGLSVATAAAACGVRVLLLDRDDGSNSDFAKSGGAAAAAGTSFQASAGVVDSPAIWTSDIKGKTGGRFESSIVQLVTTRARDAIHFQADRLKIPLHLVEGIPVAGHSVPRLYGTPREIGREYAQMLKAAAGQWPAITRIDGAEVTGLIVEKDRVEGVRAQHGYATQIYRAPFTVLCSGGFAANRTMLAQFIPEMAEALYIGCPFNDGRALTWARELGASWDFLDSYQGHGHVTADTRGRLGLGLTTLGAILVNREGRRFVKEDIGPSELAAYVQAAPGGYAVEVYDQSIHHVALQMGAYAEAIRRGAAVFASSVDALAEALSIPPANLKETIETANRAALGETPDPLHRKDFAKPLSPPFWAVKIVGALAHTQGGLLVDQHARVLRRDGSAIQGLLAAGGTVTGISGHGAAGYSSGNGLAQAFALGLIAAETLSYQTCAGLQSKPD